MGPATPHTVRLILEIVPSLADTPSASDEHHCTAVVQGGALRHSNLYFFVDQLKLSTQVCRRVNYPFALSGVHVLSFALRCESCSVLPLVRVHQLVP